jgi:hypothetical protein
MYRHSHVWNITGDTTNKVINKTQTCFFSETLIDVNLTRMSVYKHSFKPLRKISSLSQHNLCFPIMRPHPFRADCACYVSGSHRTEGGESTVLSNCATPRYSTVSLT